ncbi:LysR substrate-binding domain-containing protein [Pseudomonas syringae]|uniref:LysR family transcriptional regulator n=1 Tax=Pseudomonas syringae TaxID=317 RepID=UPI00215AF1F6|nr:LysR substrate-binding domain-containing protein [Pseudomonas syringae]MCR8718243.1 LysR substrate-binding domain-containing protein [Pseudomonas syringae]
MEAFEMTLQMGSVSRAAVALHVSQPSISRLLKDLEQDTGLQLFDRSQGRLVPTVEGQLFYSEVEKTFFSAHRLMEKAQQIKLLQSGSVRLGVMASVSLERVPVAMREFSAEYPAAMTRLTVCESPRIVELVATRVMDIGVINAYTPHLDVECLATIDRSYLGVMDSSHPYAGKPKIEMDDFRDFPFVSLGQECMGHSPDGLVLSQIVAAKVQAEAYQSFVACSLVRGTDALAIIDPFTAQFYARPGMVISLYRQTSHIVLHSSRMPDRWDL